MSVLCFLSQGGALHFEASVGMMNQPLKWLKCPIWSKCQILLTLAQTPQRALKHVSLISGVKYGHALTTLCNYLLLSVRYLGCTLTICLTLQHFNTGTSWVMSHSLTLQYTGFYLLFAVVSELSPLSLSKLQLESIQSSVCWLSANPKDTFSLFTRNDRHYWFPLESLTVTV